MRIQASVLAMVLWPLPVFSQAAPPAAPPVDQKRVDQAIFNGIRYLKEKPIPKWWRGDHSAVLVLWTFVHAGVPENDPKFQELLKKVIGMFETKKAPLDIRVSVEIVAFIEAALKSANNHGVGEKVQA